MWAQRALLAQEWEVLQELFSYMENPRVMYLGASFEWHCHRVNVMLYLSPYFQNNCQVKFVAGLETSWRSWVWRLYHSPWRPLAMNEEALVEKTCLYIETLRGWLSLEVPWKFLSESRWHENGCFCYKVIGVRRDGLGGAGWCLRGAELERLQCSYISEFTGRRNS